MQSEYYQKYLKYKKKYLMLKGGSKPLWYDRLVTEATLIYRAITQKLPESPDDPKNTIILSGSAAIALLLGNENMFKELNEIFTNDKRPSDLDFIYEGKIKDDNVHIKDNEIRIDSGITYKKSKPTDNTITSQKYTIPDELYTSLDIKPVIKDFDLTNMNQSVKEKTFTKLPYIEIYGIKVITPAKLLSLYEEYYDDEFKFTKNEELDDILRAKKIYDEKKIAQLKIFIASPELLKDYNPVNKDEQYKSVKDEESSAKRRNTGPPPKLTFDF
jgi:hypothetical protein